MNKNNYVLGGVALVIAIIALFIGIGSRSEVSAPLAGMTNLDGLTITPVDSGDGLKVGSNGSTVAELIANTCTLIGAGEVITASTTRPFDCAITGIASGDILIGQIATSTAYAPGQVMGFVIVGSKASTTAGFGSFLVFNGTGADNKMSVRGYASTTSYYLIDN